MFTKNSNTYLFPSPPLHHHSDIFSGHHYNIPALADLHRHHSSAAAAGFLSSHQDDATEKKQPTATATVKKDRHSKIFTSQGPRDRRVRLSIGIARKFFDLQEMLGFDKPSKTLDWLLTKSKAAIKDLVQAKEKDPCNKDDDNNNSSSPVPSECELGDHQYGEDHKGKSGNKNKGVAPSSSSVAKAESRAKARARARERTREKMCIKEKLKNGGEMNSADHQLISPFNYNPNPVGAAFHQQELGQESVMVRRKAKSPSSSFFGFQQNVFVSAGSGYNGGAGFGNGGSSHENWDVCSFTSILDQHKFMNRSSDM